MLPRGAITGTHAWHPTRMSARRDGQVTCALSRACRAWELAVKGKRLPDELMCSEVQQLGDMCS